MHRLEDVRLLNNYSRSQIAELLGVSKRAYTNWENNSETIPIRRLIQLSNIYRINIDYLMRLTNIKLTKNIRNYSVYARVSPEHKVRIVKAWQKNGEVVAMTGDRSK